MLNHEEMIKNVHRRIAQYEEEKKNKHSLFKSIISSSDQKNVNKQSVDKEEGYTEVASGTEKLNTSRIKLRMMGTIAAAVVFVAGIGTISTLLHKNLPKYVPEKENNNTVYTSETVTDSSEYSNGTVTGTASVETATGTSSYTGTGSNTTSTTAADITSTTAADTANSVTENEILTVDAEKKENKKENKIDNKNEASGEKTVDEPNTKSGDYLREKCLTAIYNYDSFSADFVVDRGSDERGAYRFFEGTVKIDNTAKIGDLFQKRLARNGRLLCDEYHYFLKDYYAYLSKNEGGIYSEAEKLEEYFWSKEKTDRVYFNGFSGFYYVNVEKDDEELNEDESSIRNETPWEITGERFENGRKIVSVTGSHEDLYYASLHEAPHYEFFRFTADFDDETGVCLAYRIYLKGNILIDGFKATNFKFNDEAEAPEVPSDVKELLEENGYDPRVVPEYSDHKISG